VAVPSARFGFTKLVVSDLERMAQFYSDGLGMRQVQRFQGTTGTEPFDEIIMDDGNGHALILVQYQSPSSRTVTDEVILGFVTPDITVLLSRLEAAGGNVTRQPIAVPEGGGHRVGLLGDPEGHRIEVVEVAT
jgi:predicted enzyme related to lactoylglutathione lyase